MSYVFHIPGSATNYLALQKIIKKIWKKDCRILQTRNVSFAHHFDEGWNCVVKGSPDSRFTLLCLQLPATVTHEDIIEYH